MRAVIEAMGGFFWGFFCPGWVTLQSCSLHESSFGRGAEMNKSLCTLACGFCVV